MKRDFKTYLFLAPATLRLPFTIINCLLYNNYIAGQYNHDFITRNKEEKKESKKVPDNCKNRFKGTRILRLVDILSSFVFRVDRAGRLEANDIDAFQRDPDMVTRSRECASLARVEIDGDLAQTSYPAEAAMKKIWILMGTEQSEPAAAAIEYGGAF